MAKVSRVLTAASGVLAATFAVGFFAFAGLIGTSWPVSAPVVDGIVVLTGSDERITAGLEQMAEGRGRRLLISGVNPSNRSFGALSRGLESRHLGADLSACCIDLGYRALNTRGNADEARDWAGKWGFRSLLVVTSDFHMARSMAEFSRAMPDVKLIAHPVASRYAHERWWASGVLARLLAGEYIKFLASTARIGAVRMIGAWDSFLYAEREPAASPNSGHPETRLPKRAS